MTKAFVISCEYATCAVPEAYREIFDPVEALVTSPAGWDSGALNLAQSFATKLGTQLVHGNFTRLLIDLDRDGDARWSDYALRIPEPSRLRLAEREENSYREPIRARIADEMTRHELVLHLSIRTMDWTPGRIEVDSFARGSLGEGLAEAWHRRMLIAGLDVGHCMACDDSALAADFGGMFPPDRYGFVRLKVAQSFFLEGRPLKWEPIKKKLLECLTLAIGDVDEALEFLARQAEAEALQAAEPAASPPDTGAPTVAATPYPTANTMGAHAVAAPPAAPVEQPLMSDTVADAVADAVPDAEIIAVEPMIEAPSSGADWPEIGDAVGTPAGEGEAPESAVAAAPIAEPAPDTARAPEPMAAALPPEESAAEQPVATSQEEPPPEEPPVSIPEANPEEPAPVATTKKPARKRTRKNKPARKPKAEGPGQPPPEPVRAEIPPPVAEPPPPPEEPDGQRLLF